MAVSRFSLATAVVFLDETAYYAMVPLLPVFATEFHLSRVEVGLFIACYPFVGLVSGIPGGLLVDRVGPRRILMIGVTLAAAGALTIGVAPSPFYLWVGRVLQGLSLGLNATAAMVWIASAATTKGRAGLISLAAALAGASAFAGPAIGGFLEPLAGRPAAFSLLSLIGVCVVVALHQFSSEQPQSRRATKMSGRDYATLMKPLRGAICCIAIVGCIDATISTLAPLSLSRAGYTTSTLGLLLLGGAMISVFFTPAVGWFADRIGSHVLGGYVRWALVAIALAFSMPTGATVEAVLLMLAVPILRSSSFLAYAIAAERNREPGRLGVVYGVIVAVWALAVSVTPPLIAALAAVAGDATAFVTVSITAIALTLFASLEPSVGAVRPDEAG